MTIPDLCLTPCELMQLSEFHLPVHLPFVTRIPLNIDPSQNKSGLVFPYHPTLHLPQTPPHSEEDGVHRPHRRDLAQKGQIPVKYIATAKTMSSVIITAWDLRWATPRIVNQGRRRASGLLAHWEELLVRSY